MAEVVLEHVSKRYAGGVEAVRGFDLRVDDGEFVVLVGPSGCGKTTTLRLIAGLEDLTEGTIRIGGRVVNRMHPKDRDIAMVFQDYALYPHMTVRRNMSFGLQMRKTPRDVVTRRVADTATLLGISELLDRKPAVLSGGQRQRVAVGRAIVRQPACFLFDEPLSNLDAKLRLQMRAELKALHLRLRTTTVYVTHDQEEAMTLGDRLVVMAGGAIQQIGTPLEVYRRPVNRFVAGFVGSPAMNFIEGRLEAEDGAHTLVVDDALRVRLDRVPTVARNGQPIALGIRPEQLHLAQDVAGDIAFPATVRVIEVLGERMDVFADLPGGHTVVARVPATHALEPGASITLTAESGKLHLFEPGEFGRNLSEPA